MTSPTDVPPSGPRVIAVVIGGQAGEVSEVLQTIHAQAYELEDVVVVADASRRLDGGGAPFKRVGSMGDAVALAGDGVDYLWLVHNRTTARPDALEALVSTAVQVDASVVGSKVLDVANPQQLLFVGGATDVFGFPYTGLDHGELDQEQFDVIRDVAYVEPASILVRRDLFGGLRGLDPKLPYIATGLDLCQRARVVGGRVVVAPTSEVFSRSLGDDRVHTWREQAGRIRVMLKTYSFVTLQWTIPGLLMLGLLAGFYRTARGSFGAIPDWAKAWLWNVRHLPSTLEARRKAPRVSMASDAELFRFQVRGSVELRAIASGLASLLGSGIDQDHEEEDVYDPSPAFWQRPAVIGAVSGAVFILILSRSILVEGLPTVGFVLPLADSAWNTLRAYAGGWHPGGLGSPEPMHPSIGATAAVQLVLGNRAALAAVVMTVGSAASGLAGTVTFLRRCGARPGARFLSGAVFVAGFPMLFLAGAGYWPGMLAMGGLPWALSGVVSPVPAGAVARIGRLARIGLATGWSAMFVPLLAGVPILFGLVWAVLERKYRAFLMGGAGSLIALPTLLPWLATRDVAAVVTGGVPLHLDPSWWVWPPIVVAALASVSSGRGRPVTLTAAGMLLGAGGFVLARSADLGTGREPTAAGIVVVAIAVALIVAGAVDGVAMLDEAEATRRLLAYVGVVAALLVGVVTLLVLPAGRMGLPGDRFGTLEFAQGRAGSHGSDRILMAGPGDTLPGEYRRLPDGTAYRTVGGTLDYPQAWLPEPLAGDVLLEEALVSIGSDQELRPGEKLAGFGIRWVVFTGSANLAEEMSTQFDLRPLTGLFVGESGGVWENDAPAYRAVTDSGIPWSWVPPDYTGRRSGTTVRISENSDPRWGPGSWEEEGWANRVALESGTVAFAGDSSHRFQARLSGVWVLILIGLASGSRTGRRAGAA